MDFEIRVICVRLDYRLWTLKITTAYVLGTGYPGYMQSRTARLLTADDSECSEERDRITDAVKVPDMHDYCRLDTICAHDATLHSFIVPGFGDCKRKNGVSKPRAALWVRKCQHRR